jgi:hypothetical protein
MTAPPSIPRQIHQTWKNADVPEKFAAYQQSWLARNPEWRYTFWTDAASRRFVASHAPGLVAVYDGFPHPIQRVDMVRYLWMHQFGGVYADLDCECLRPLDELLEGRELVLGMEPDEHLRECVSAHGMERIVGNAFIASRPGHPFWEHLLRTIVSAPPVDDPLASTGPFILTRAIAEYSHPEQISIATADQLYPVSKTQAWNAEGARDRLRVPDGAFVVHHWAGTWWRGATAESRREPPPAKSVDSSILIATPVKDARGYLPRYLENLRALTYAHDRIAVAFIESDSTDGTYEWLCANAAAALSGFQRVEVHKADFGFRSEGPRWATSIQRTRREILARSRNRLLQRALRDETWVLWIDADVVRYPADVIEQLLAAKKDIVVPHCLGPNGRTFDLNTFRSVPDADLSSHVVDGILQPPRGVGRLYLEDLRDEALAPVDGVGGTMLLVRADHHRDGLIFPAYSHRLHIETEGLAMMAADMGLRCWALPRLEIIHA